MAKIENIERILVVEDTEMHIEAAREQLRDYKLTIASDYRKFLEQLLGTCIVKMIAGYPDRIELAPGFPKSSSYDVVLTDMNFPEKQGGSENTLGYVAAMMCAAARVPLIGIVSATNHHKGPLAEGLAKLEYSESKGVFQVGDTRIMYFDDDDFGTRNEPKRWDKALECLSAGRNVYKFDPWSQVGKS